MEHHQTFCYAIFVYIAELIFLCRGSRLAIDMVIDMIKVS
jgi:hypothetical protein